MIDNKPEATEQPKPERTVSLGEEFHPFDPKYTVYRPEIRGSYEEIPIKSPIQLNLEGTNFPLEIEASSHSDRLFNNWGMCITPFDPELGYQIDSDDLNLATRRKKLKRLGDKLLETINSEKAPYLFQMSAIERNLNKVGLNKKRAEDTYEYEFPKDTIDLLRRLRLHVFFPKLRFEGKIDELFIKDGSIHFFDFYPADTGPLPVGDEEIDVEGWLIRDGLFLALPSDPEKLAQIRARFVLVEEQPQGH